jgi:hypothetical protein
LTLPEQPRPIHIPSAADDPAAYQRVLLEVAADADPLGTIAGMPAKVGEICRDLPIDLLHRRPDPGEWSIAEIVGHLLDDDIVYGFRWRLVLTEQNPSYPGFDEQRWSTLVRLPFWPMLNAWEGLRGSNVALLRALTPDDLQRTGVHAEQGVETLGLMLRKVTGHDIAHLNQIERTAWAVQQ